MSLRRSILIVSTVAVVLLVVAAPRLAALVPTGSPAAAEEAFGTIWGPSAVPEGARVTARGGGVFAVALTPVVEDSSQTVSISAWRCDPVTGAVDATATVVVSEGSHIADTAWLAECNSKGELFVLWKRDGEVFARLFDYDADARLLKPKFPRVVVGTDDASTPSASLTLGQVVTDDSAGIYVSLRVKPAPATGAATLLNHVDGGGKPAELPPGLPVIEGSVADLAAEGGSAYALLLSPGTGRLSLTRYTDALEIDLDPCSLYGKESTPTATPPPVPADLVADAGGVWVAWRDANGLRLQRVSKLGALTWKDGPKKYPEASDGALAGDGLGGAYLVSGAGAEVVVRHFVQDDEKIVWERKLPSGLSGAARIRGAVGDRAGDLCVTVDTGSGTAAELVRATGLGAEKPAQQRLPLAGSPQGATPLLDDEMGGVYTVSGTAAAPRLARFNLKDPPALSCVVRQQVAPQVSLGVEYDFTIEYGQKLSLDLEGYAVNQQWGPILAADAPGLYWKKGGENGGAAAPAFPNILSPVEVDGDGYWSRTLPLKGDQTSYNGQVRLQISDGTASASVRIGVEPKVTARLSAELIGGRPYFVITGKVGPRLKNGKIRLVFDKGRLDVVGKTTRDLTKGSACRFELRLPTRRTYVEAHLEVPASPDSLKGTSNVVKASWM